MTVKCVARGRGWTPAGASLVLLLLVLAGCAGRERAPEVELRVPVSVAPVGTGTVEDVIVATGTLRTAEVATLRAETPGVLVFGRNHEGRRWREGDRVRSGDLVAEITGEDVRVQARTEATRQRYEAALRDYESKKRLFEAGLIAELELEQAEATLAEAKIAWEQSRVTETKARIVSPLDGVILEIARDRKGDILADGVRVEAGITVARIAPVDTLLADVDLVGPDIRRVHVGQEVRIRYRAWDDRSFRGRVLRLAPEVDPETRTFRVEVAVANPDRVLRPGMFVEARILVERRENVPVVPREAVVERAGRKVVFVLDGRRVAARPVRLGLGDDEIVEVVDGVRPGERIVVRGLETLTDGTPVRVTEG